MKEKIWLCTLPSIIFCFFCFFPVHGSSLQRHVSERHAMNGYAKEDAFDGDLLYLQAGAEDPRHTDEGKRQAPEAPSEDTKDTKDTKETYYAVLCIENNTTIDITYWYKWGEGAWGSFVLKSKERKLHSRPWKEKEDAQTFPDFLIKFYTDISGKSHAKESILKTYLAPEDSCNYGKVYHFKRKEQHIDLTEN